MSHLSYSVTRRRSTICCGWLRFTTRRRAFHFCWLGCTSHIQRCNTNCYGWREHGAVLIVVVDGVVLVVGDCSRTGHTSSSIRYYGSHWARCGRCRPRFSRCSRDDRRSRWRTCGCVKFLEKSQMGAVCGYSLGTTTCKGGTKGRQLPTNRQVEWTSCDPSKCSWFKSAWVELDFVTKKKNQTELL